MNSHPPACKRSRGETPSERGPSRSRSTEHRGQRSARGRLPPRPPQPNRQRAVPTRRDVRPRPPRAPYLCAAAPGGPRALRAGQRRQTDAVEGRARAAAARRHRSRRRAAHLWEEGGVGWRWRSRHRRPPRQRLRRPPAARPSPDRLLSACGSGAAGPARASFVAAVSRAPGRPPARGAQGAPPHPAAAPSLRLPPRPAPAGGPARVAALCRAGSRPSSPAPRSSPRPRTDRHRREHPGELLPPHGAALLRVSGTLSRGLWPLNAAPRHSGLWARCRPASQSPGGYHSPPWQPSYACLGSRLPGTQRRPDDGGPPAASRSVWGTESWRQGAEARPCLPPTTTEFPWEDRAGYGKARNAASLRATRWAGQARQAPPWDESPLSDTPGPSSGASLKQPELCASPLPSAETCVGTAKPQPCRLLASSTPGARVPGKRDTSLLACQTCPSHEGKPGVMEGMPTLVHGAGWEGDSTPTSPHSASSSTAPAWAFISHLVKWTVLSWTCKVP